MSSKLVESTAIASAAVILAACATSPNAVPAGATPAPAPVAARPTGFAYQPGNLQYRIIVTSHTTQEMQGQKMEDSGTVMRVITVALQPQGTDALGFTYRVDSATTTHPQAKEMVAQQQGKQVTGTVSPLGNVLTINVPVDSTQPMLKTQLESYRYFLLRLPNRDVKVGDSWTDTVTQKFSNQGIQGTSTLVVTSRVLGDTTVAGRGAWRVQRSGMMTTTGSGSQGGQPLVLEGHGQLNGTSYVSPRGVYLGSEEMQTALLTVHAPAMNMTIPISQRITSHTELLSGGR